MDLILKRVVLGCAIFSVACWIASVVEASDSSSFRFQAVVTTPLDFSNVPVDPEINFEKMIRTAGMQGVLDPSSIEVIDVVTGASVPHAFSGFDATDQGRVEWVIADPTHIEYEVRFRVVDNRPDLQPKKNIPLIGVGDLLRYNAGESRPITLFYAAGLADSPAERRHSAELALEATYPIEEERPFFWRTGAAIADFNGDGLMDLVTLTGDTRQAALFARYRDQDGVLRLRKENLLHLADGRPVDDRIVGRNSHWTESFRAVDWDSDGLVDLMYSLAGAHGGIQDQGSIYLLRNIGTATSPEFEPPETMRCYGEPIRVTNHGPSAWPGDIDGDGKPDLVACVEWSVYPIYRHAALMMPSRPEFRFEKIEAYDGR